MSQTSVIRWGWGKVCIAGLLIMVFGVAILGANGSERVDKVADELVEASSVLPENEGKLVIVSGTPQLLDGGVIVDEEAGLRAENAISYQRVPYQKIYVEEKREIVVDKGENKHSPDDDDVRTEYYVTTDWIVANRSRDSVIWNNFKKYENPPAVGLDAFYVVNDLSLSGFLISPSSVQGYIQTEGAGYTQEELEQACGSYIVRSELNLRPVTRENGYGMLSTGDEIGDVHVLFSYQTFEGAEPVTVIGRQRGDKIVVEEEELLGSSEYTWPGVVSKEEILDSMAAEDSSSRKIGFGCIAVGLLLILASLNWRLPGRRR